MSWGSSRRDRWVSAPLCPLFAWLPSPLPAGQMEQELPRGSCWEAPGYAQHLSEASSWLSGVYFWSWGDAAAFSVLLPWPLHLSLPSPPVHVSYSILNMCLTVCPCQPLRSAQLFCLTTSKLCNTRRDGLLAQETLIHTGRWGVNSRISTEDKWPSLIYVTKYRRLQWKALDRLKIPKDRFIFSLPSIFLQQHIRVLLPFSRKKNT